MVDVKKLLGEVRKREGGPELVTSSDQSFGGRQMIAWRGEEEMMMMYQVYFPTHIE